MNKEEGAPSGASNNVNRGKEDPIHKQGSPNPNQSIVMPIQRAHTIMSNSKEDQSKWKGEGRFHLPLRCLINHNLNLKNKSSNNTIRYPQLSF